MIEWKEIETLIRQKTVLLRQNKDEAEPSELVQIIVTQVKSILEDVIETGIDNWPVEESIRRLRDLEDAYTSGDIVYLADVLEYEMLDLIYYMEENYK